MHHCLPTVLDVAARVHMDAAAVHHGNVRQTGDALSRVARIGPVGCCRAVEQGAFPVQTPGDIAGGGVGRADAARTLVVGLRTRHHAGRLKRVQKELR